jgi:hypothetical protein
MLIVAVLALVLTVAALWIGLRSGPNRRAQERQHAAAQKNCGDLECPLGRWVTEGIRLRKQQFSREVSQCEPYISWV